MAESDENRLIVKTSKVEMTIPDPDTSAQFTSKVLKTGGSLRVTIPSDIVELLDIKSRDFLDIRITKRKKKSSTETIGREF